MGKDYEILEEQYQKILADKTATEGRDDLSDPEKANALAGFDSALNALEENIVALGVKAKEEIMQAIRDLEEKMAKNNEFLEKSKARIEELEAMIAEEEGKGEAGDKDKIRIYQAEIKGIEKEMRLATRGINAAKREIKENNKKLIPIMNIFKDKGVFTQDEIDSLTKLQKRIDRAKKNFGPKDEPVVPGDGDGTDEPVVPGDGDGTDEPVVPGDGDGTDEPVVPGDGDGTDEPVVPGDGDGTDEPVVPGGSGTTAPGGSRTTAPGGSGTTAPGGSGTTAPGGSGTTAPGGSRTTAPGGSRTTAPEPEEISLKEFDEIYRAAKQKCLGTKDMEKLYRIMADPKAYEKYGITTGIFRNKAKVLLTAMGHQMSSKYGDTIKRVASEYGIKQTDDFGKDVVPSSEIRTWSGIKEMASNAKTKTKAQAIFERVVETARAKEAAGEPLTSEEAYLCEQSEKELGKMSQYRTILSTYSEVKRKRARNPLSWFTGLGRRFALPSGDEPERDTSVEDSVRADIDRIGRDAAADADRTMTGAMLIAALASESEREPKGTAEPAVVAVEEPVAPEAPAGPTDMMETLSAGVFPPEEMPTVVERPAPEAPATEFDGPGIDG